MEPRLKASLVKSSLAEIRRLEPADANAVESKVSPQTLHTIDEASSLAWIPMRIQVELDRVVYEQLGSERLTELTRDWTRAATLTPLVAPVLRGTLSLFGSGTALVVKMLPRFWRMTSRDCGRIEVAVDPSGGTLSYEELPEIMRVAPFVAASAGGLWGMVDLFNEGRGTVESDDSRLGSGRVVHSFRFS